MSGVREMSESEINFVIGLQVYAALGFGILLGMGFTVLSGAVSEIKHKG